MQEEEFEVRYQFIDRKQMLFVPQPLKSSLLSCLSCKARLTLAETVALSHHCL